MTTTRRTSLFIAAAFAALALVGGLVFASPALANKELTSPVQVSDDITRLHVSKLDADTHEYVSGAQMAIIEKDTGLVVDEWTTDGTTHQNEKGLDVDKVYILREMSAPEGYEVVTDTEFVVNATEGTGITILSGDDAELTESYKVNLYDKAKPRENELVVTQTREVSGSTSNNVGNNVTNSVNNSSNKTSTTGGSVVAPKTGDETPMALIAVLVGIGILAIGILEMFKRRTELEQTNELSQRKLL